MANKILSNESFEYNVSKTEMDIKKHKVEQAVIDIFDALGVNYQTDHNAKDTPKRFAKMMCDELLAGMFTEPPKITEFDNAKNYDELICIGPMIVTSMCSHHWQPINGYCYIGVLPNALGKIIGLSKYARIVEWFGRRFQIQEEMVSQIADFIEDKVKPSGLAVKVYAKHGCMANRGVMQQASIMDTTVVRGLMRESASLKQEFLTFCALANKGLSY